ncbi:dihydroorotate dehydrogenase electron transfer subunit [uncultured Oscillibacter sp.]|uniref:dihydroorotate dehydrogenase electron transfer subunit n=2 Tax=uncultured Oscillibacter sp. TaxID=876091 RepID=UPI0025D46837|nr:dihydroorotate dehydrogenase electron transfer subunit [uncultured Oscillibacter sp.]
MKQSNFTVARTHQLTRDVWELVLAGDTSAITAPGQFVNIALPGRFLRRPISVCDWTAGELTLLVKKAGEGTRELVRMAPGTELDVLSGLGNGFNPAKAAGKNAVLVGGGIGIAPLVGLARQMLEAGQSPIIVLGYRSAEESFCQALFAAWNMDLRIATEDGSLGAKGFVTDLLRTFSEDIYVLACGPTPMLRSICSLPNVTGGQFSFEARMACGFGACVGCSIPTANGPRRVCKDGPIFQKEEIVW